MALLFNVTYKQQKTNNTITFYKEGNTIRYSQNSTRYIYDWPLKQTPLDWLIKNKYICSQYHPDPVINKIRELESRRKAYASV